MKVIVSSLHFLDHFRTREFSWIIRDLVTMHGWMNVEVARLSNGPGVFRDKLRAELGGEPEVIVFWELYQFVARHADQIERLDCLKAIVVDDLHWRTEQARWSQMLTYMIVDLIFSTYAYVFHESYPEAREFARCIWMPHSASPDFLVPYNHKPENALLLSGAISDRYTLRQKLKALCDDGQHRIVHHPHPGPVWQFDHESDGRVGRAYGRLINRYRAAFTDCSIYRYTVAKHFEIPAAGALLLADRAVAGPLEQLGFVAGEHYVATSEEDLEEQVRYVLEEAHAPELDAIRRRGRELVWGRHKTSDRADLIDAACRSAR
jgi:hypothetical protein